MNSVQHTHWKRLTNTEVCDEPYACTNNAQIPISSNKLRVGKLPALVNVNTVITGTWKAFTPPKGKSQHSSIS